MESERLTRRYQASIVALVLVLILGVAAEAFTPSALAVERPRERTASRADPERRARTQEFLRRLRSDVGAEIVGGTRVPQGRRLFMAYIQIEVLPDQFGRCGGSLIDPWYVLTAAHCVVDDQGIELDESQLALAIGKANWPDYEDENVYYVYDIIPHPNYDPATSANDVAVLELDFPVPGAIAQPIRMVERERTDLDRAGQVVTTAGWGTTSSGGAVSNQLLETNLKVVGDSDCAAALGAEFSDYQDVMICAAYVGRDSCQGDSGGPLFARDVVGYKVKKRKKRRKRVPIYASVQMGIVSWGIGCATPGFPGVYTRLSAAALNDFVEDATDY